MADHNPDPGSTSPVPSAPEALERALGDAAATVNQLNQEAARAAPAGVTRGASAANQAAADPIAPKLPDFDLASLGVTKKDIELLSDVNLNVTIELGRTRMLIEDVLRLAAGAVIELDKLAGDPVDVFVNERLVAKGEVLVLNDNFCVRINEIVDSSAADKA